MNWVRRAVVATVTVVLSLTVIGTAQAAPEVGIQGGCDYVAGQELCGRVVNNSGSDKWMAVANDWNCGGSGTACGTKVRLYPGDYSTDYFRDADGVYIPSGCVAQDDLGQWYGGGKWSKIINFVGYWRFTVYC